MAYFVVHGRSLCRAAALPTPLVRYAALCLHARMHSFVHLLAFAFAFLFSCIILSASQQLIALRCVAL